eukprot:137883-Prorocentrum_minimum.AAC.1
MEFPEDTSCPFTPWEDGMVWHSVSSLPRGGPAVWWAGARRRACGWICELVTSRWSCCMVYSSAAACVWLDSTG